MLGLGPTELIIIAFLIILLFGVNKLPQLAKATGESLREFKKASREALHDDEPPVVANAPVETQRRMEAPAENTTTSNTTNVSS